MISFPFYQVWKTLTLFQQHIEIAEVSSDGLLRGSIGFFLFFFPYLERYFP